MSKLFSFQDDSVFKQEQSRSHTYVFIGQAASGKSTLIEKLSSKSNLAQTGLLYSYSRLNISGVPCVQQLFEVSGAGFKDLLVLPLTKQSYTQLSFVLVIDLSSDDLVNNLEKEIQFIRDHQEKTLNEILTPQEYQTLETQSYENIQQHHDRARMRPLLIPLIIIGNKYDLFQKQLDIETRKWITRALRYLAHINNASILFADANDHTYLRPQLNNEIKKQSLFYIDHLKQISVTRQADSMENIQLPPGGNNALDSFNKIIKDQLSGSNKKKNPTAETLVPEWDKYKEERIDRLIRQNEFK